MAGNSIGNLNAKVRSDNKSGHTGIYWNDQRQKFQAQIQIEGKKKTLGWFDHEIEAIEARNEAKRQVIEKYKGNNQSDSLESGD